MKQISTTALAKERNIQVKELFSILTTLGYIDKINEKLGDYRKRTSEGAEPTKNQKSMENYITWPENLEIEEKTRESQVNHINRYW